MADDGMDATERKRRQNAERQRRYRERMKHKLDAHAGESEDVAALRRRVAELEEEVASLRATMAPPPEQPPVPEPETPATLAIKAGVEPLLEVMYDLGEAAVDPEPELEPDLEIPPPPLSEEVLEIEYPSSHTSRLLDPVAPAGAPGEWYDEEGLFRGRPKEVAPEGIYAKLRRALKR